MRSAALVTAGLGVLVAGYLTYVQYAGVAPVCAGGSTGCEEVQSSSWAKLAGVPVALLGLLGFVAILGATVVRGETAVMTAAALSLVGAGFSAYLTYLELFEIDAICQWCVVTALLMAALAVLGVLRLLRA